MNGKILAPAESARGIDLDDGFRLFRRQRSQAAAAAVRRFPVVFGMEVDEGSACQQKQHEQPEEHAPFAPGLGVMGIWVGMAHGGLVYTLDEMEWQ
ncbi:hypothetical protein HMPREF3038_02251 [Akkermansia sp. KLE1797]|nr:hypothetical protein HMPREF3038_02251 [Akkermansia sp. KLE1797]KXU53212.1 hypothetical protein HMPREF3039_02622 [Akkermansia sp. KLE1798]